MARANEEQSMVTIKDLLIHILNNILVDTFSGDGCRRDEDGYHWITGRVDDVINVSGHRLGTAEVESALVLHKDVAEAAVVGYPHKIKGQGLYAFVALNKNVESSHVLENGTTTMG